MATVTEQIKRLREQETTEETETCQVCKVRNPSLVGRRPCLEVLCDDCHADHLDLGCADCAAELALDDTED